METNLEYKKAQKSLEKLTSKGRRVFSDDGITAILSAISPDAIKDILKIVRKYNFILIKQNRVSDNILEIKAFFQGFLGDYTSGDPLDVESYWERIEQGSKALDVYNMIGVDSNRRLGSLVSVCGV